MLPPEFNLEDYSFDLYEWYSPVFVMLKYNELLNLYPNQEDHYLFKKAKEAMQGAMAILGSRKLHENNTSVMQMNKQSRRPDVIAATPAKLTGVPTLKISPLEITEMEVHTLHQDIARFLLDTKLNKKYPKETIFICMVNKVLNYDIHDIAKRIKSANRKNPIYIVGKAKDEISTSFFIASPQPIIAKTKFDLVEQGRNYPYPYRITFTEDKSNMNPVFTPVLGKPIDLFDFFMLDRARIDKAFGTQI